MSTLCFFGGYYFLLQQRISRCNVKKNYSQYIDTCEDHCIVMTLYQTTKYPVSHIPVPQFTPDEFELLLPQNRAELIQF